MIGVHDDGGVGFRVFVVVNVEAWPRLPSRDRRLQRRPAILTPPYRLTLSLRKVTTSRPRSQRYRGQNCRTFRQVWSSRAVAHAAKLLARFAL